ncbi:aromatic prenyltransferase [Astrocystis sublimbata]|nr:aromatic prenyltransferase [Astrocystis sublimbata]
MAAQVETPVFHKLDLDAKSDHADRSDTPGYWWLTSGRDLAKMMAVAKYSEEAQHSFLRFFRDTISPHLGSRPDSTSGRSGVGWDGNPFEYSFELKGASSTPSVRFVVDFTQLRPTDPEYPFSITSTQEVVDELAKKTPGFDDTWYRNLVKWFTYSHLDSNEQKDLAIKAGYNTSMIIGFDIYRNAQPNDGLPVMGKVYFPPCFTAARQGKSRWQVVRDAVHQLPEIHQYPNIIQSLSMIEDYLSTKPRDWEDGARYLATDFIEPGKARLKIYFRFGGDSFDEIWDYYTLGGRIPGLDEDKTKFRELVELTSGAATMKDDVRPFTNVARKATAIYFSLSADNPCPAPKINFYPANFASNDESIVRGLDSWLQKYGLNAGGSPMEERVKSVFTHRSLGEKTGIMTFLGIGRKEDPSKKDLSLQVYVTPELYLNSRI